VHETVSFQMQFCETKVKRMNITEIGLALSEMRLFLDEYPLEKHVGEAIYGIYMRLIEAL
jgi:hypothetical protein|tara:strand:- start:30 stop:209 length:180 start_codon:yes stop_codon:yes gene_type:complete